MNAIDRYEFRWVTGRQKESSIPAAVSYGHADPTADEAIGNVMHELGCLENATVKARSRKDKVEKKKKQNSKTARQQGVEVDDARGSS